MPDMSESDLAWLNKYIESILAERHQLYTERTGRFDDKLVAIEKSITAAFASSDRAMVKAEEAQREYNARSNEFRSMLDDWRREVLTRSEIMQGFKVLEDKLAALSILAQAAFPRKEHEVYMNAMGADIRMLRESRAELAGKASQEQLNQTQVQVTRNQLWTVAAVLIAAIGILIAGIGLTIQLIHVRGT